MSNPAISGQFWSELVGLNKHADSLVERVRRAVEPSQPISREIPAIVSIETRFNSLPTSYGSTVATGSDALAGNNVKRGFFQNGGSRIYIRELAFQSWFVLPVNPTGIAPSYDARMPNERTIFPFNWRWNFQTSITQRWYADRRLLAQSGGRAQAGNHLSFRKPLVIEPMETFTFECELLGGFGMAASAQSESSSAVISMLLSGYREGV